MNQAEPTLEASIAEVMQGLPAPLRRYLGEGRHELAAKRLAVKYRLHIEQSAIIERELMLLLLGIENPDEFAESLKKEAAIPENVALQIITDLNQEVFIPLQAQVREEVGEPAPKTPPPAPVATERGQRLSENEGVLSSTERMYRPNVPVPPPPAYTPPKTSQNSPPRFSTPVPNPSAFGPQTSRSHTSPQVLPPVPQEPPTPRPYTPPPPPPRQVASAPLPPKTTMPGVGANGQAQDTVSVNRLQGRTVPPPVYDPAARRPQPPPTEPRSYGSDPYRESTDLS